MVRSHCVLSGAKAPLLLVLLIVSWSRVAAGEPPDALDTARDAVEIEYSLPRLDQAVPPAAPVREVDASELEPSPPAALFEGAGAAAFVPEGTPGVPSDGSDASGRRREGSGGPQASDGAPAAAPLGGVTMEAGTGSAPDPRVVEADGLIGDRATYGRAISLYDAYLAEHPDDDEVRTRTARVLAWNGQMERSIAEYDQLVGTDRASDLAVERAEVLSWAGRYDEAEDAFAYLIASRPDDARSAVGIARVYRWAGRAHEADRAYAHALAIADNGEARAEWNGLRDLYPPQVRAIGERASDNQDFSFDDLGSEASMYLDLRTRVVARVTKTRLRGPLPLAVGATITGTLDGFDYSLRTERHVGRDWLAAGEIGYETWDGSPDEIRAGVSLRFAASDTSSLTVGYHHGGIARHVQSLQAAAAGIHRDELELSLWQDLPGAFDFWGRVGGGWFSDGDARAGGEASVGCKPLAGHDLLISLGINAVHYTDASPLYYTPNWNVDSGLRARYVRSLPLNAELTVGAGVGYGASNEGALTSNGVAYSVNGTLHWQWRLWALEADAWFSQSWRDSAYRSQRFALRLERSF